MLSQSGDIIRHLTQEQLDQAAVTIEFTLMSLAQSLALSFLALSAIEPLMGLEYQYWPYIAAGLIMVFFLWAEAIIHALSFINWPIDLTHNFIYFIIMLIEVIVFSELTDPSRWFIANVFLFVAAWVLYLVDIPLIRRREADFTGEVGKAFYEGLVTGHRQQTRLISFGILYALGSFLAIQLQPGFFLAEGGHIYLIVVQTVIGMVILIKTVKNFYERTHLITKLGDLG